MLRSKATIRKTAAALVAAVTLSAGLSTPASAADPGYRTRPSGLPFDSGVFARNSAGVADAFQGRRGADLDVLSVYADGSSQSAAAKAWWTSAVPSDFHGTLALGMPLWTQDSSVEGAARGDMDWVYRAAAEGLKSAGYGNAYVRLSWEMNIFSASESGTATPDNAAQWITAFQRAAQVFKSVSPDFRIVFNPNAGPSQTGIEAEQVYPGDEYVDVIGLDAYDWWPAYTSDDNWHQHLYESHGWDFWMQFARNHGKKFALPEWGLARANSHSGGDNPKYIGYVYSYLLANADQVAYESYFDETADFCQCALSQSPNAEGDYGWWMQYMRYQRVMGLTLA